MFIRRGGARRRWRVVKRRKRMPRAAAPRRACGVALFDVQAPAAAACQPPAGDEACAVPR